MVVIFSTRRQVLWEGHLLIHPVNGSFMAAQGPALFPCLLCGAHVVRAVLVTNLESTYLWLFHRWTLYLQ